MPSSTDGATTDERLIVSFHDRLLYSTQGKDDATARPRSPAPQVSSRLHAESLWRLGYTGAGVHVAVFDTGLGDDVPQISAVEERTNWTDEPDASDKVGHGTHVASVIASGSGCKGLAPDAVLHIFKVFNSKQVSYTSWFLDAFEYVLQALHKKVHVLNLSIGGPDFADLPFLRKIDEVVASNVIIVSGVGNSGPLWGTLMNPADQPDVIGVGGVDDEGRVADFSSRGMTSWELPEGYGRVKPDVLTYGSRVLGLSLSGGCKYLSGTSVACPVVAGAIALLVSIVPEPKRWQLLNPAVMKQILTQTARRLPSVSAYEQGAGTIDLLAAAQRVTDYVPHASVLPPSLDLSPCSAAGGPTFDENSGDGYTWPHCAQPLFTGAMPLLVNLTVLNGLSRTSRFSRPPAFLAAHEGHAGLLSLSFQYAPLLSPFGGPLGVTLQASPSAADFEGTVSGEVSFELEALDGLNDKVRSAVTVPLTVHIIRPPPRRHRLLFDQWHSVRYPPAYVPRDDLSVTDELLDWTGDHLHTNMRDLFIWLREHGYYVETLSAPFTHFNASNYAALLLVDAEAEYSPEEARKLRLDVLDEGLSLVVLAEWYNLDVLKAVKFFNENTRTWWTPITGGANVPALNELLAPFGVAFGDAVVRGDVSIGGSHVQVASAASIARFPAGGWLLRAPSLQDEGAKLTQSSSSSGGSSGGSYFSSFSAGPTRRDVPVLGLLQLQGHRAGRVVAFGDSDCVDSVSLQQGAAPCWWLLHAMLDFACEGERDRALFPDELRLPSTHQDASPLPARPHPQSAALRRWDDRGKAQSTAEPSGIIASAELQRIDKATEERSMKPSVGVVHSIVSSTQQGRVSAARTASGAMVLCAVVAALAYLIMLMRSRRRALKRSQPFGAATSHPDTSFRGRPPRRGYYMTEGDSSSDGRVHAV